MAVVIGNGTSGTDFKSDRTSLPTGTSDPSSPSVGDVYYKTDTKKVRVYDGSSWTDI